MTAGIVTLMATNPHPVSRTVDIDGPVNFVEYEGPKNSPTIVCVHGLGGSNVNWMAIAPSLAKHARVLALDLVGHGMTPAGSRHADINGHRRLLSGFLREVAVAPAILIGNSMGGLVSILQAAKEPDSVSGLVLLDPAVPTTQWGKIHPRAIAWFLLVGIPGLPESLLSQRRKCQSPERSVHRVLAACCVDPSRVPPDVVAAQVHMLQYGDRAAMDMAYLTSARSLSQMFLRPKSFAQILHGVDQPTLLLHGAADRLVPIHAAQQLRRAKPDWKFDIAEGVGHIPMMEDPEWTLDRITGWLGLEGAQAAVISAQAARTV